ncbi:hypothetical protein [Persicitalea jodogahamensis]|uniref:Uncharacterized protein n=1 Tax=Persicitalea jodogahamensis TaxID=402147 RepID=A0A8J3DBA8_9BACT|nr:hypothetical protein [Persicitalea jodogahamensis]GHB78586.1 hypothetical protein GCM10007390_36150 [Persicitalea jodogahamensis]
MEATLNFNIPLSIHELAELIREQLPEQDRTTLANLLLRDNAEDEQDVEGEPTQEQLVAEMKQAVREVNLAKKGKLKLPTLDEFLNEL